MMLSRGSVTVLFSLIVISAPFENNFLLLQSSYTTYVLDNQCSFFEKISYELENSNSTFDLNKEKSENSTENVLNAIAI